MTDLLLRHGEWDAVDPASASWRYLSFRVERLRDGDDVARRSGDEEIALVSLGGRCAAESEGERWELGGRATVFDGMPSALYLPRDSEYRLTAIGDAEVAVCGALADELESTSDLADSASIINRMLTGWLLDGLLTTD